MTRFARAWSVVVAVVLTAGSGYATWQEAGWIEDFEIALDTARRSGKPVFVYFDAPWCSWCQQYRRDTLDKPEVRQVLARDYVPVVVNFDARPELMQRYGGKGLPFTVLLSPQAQVRNRFVGVMTPTDLIDLLARFRTGAAAPPPAFEAGHVVRVESLDRRGYDAFRRAFLAHLESLYDARAGTLIGRFETGATLKRPSPLSWIYLMDHGLWPERVPRAAAVERERLHDPLDGGFFNFLDPSRPGGEYLESSKILEGNAWLAAWMTRAGKENAAARAAARSGWFYLRDVLWDKERGGFWQAQVADEGYYRLPRAERRQRTPPALDRIKRADTNAQAALALLRMGQALKDSRMIDFAARTLDFVLVTMVREDALYHAWREGGLTGPGLPQDLFWVLAAGAELERERPDAKRRAVLDRLRIEAARWLAQRMRANEILPVEFAGLIAWVARDEAGPFPPGARDWALRQLRIEAETAPDELVMGLRAWDTARPQRAR